MDVIDLCSSCSEDDDYVTMSQEPRQKKQKLRQTTGNTSIQYPIHIEEGTGGHSTGSINVTSATGNRNNDVKGDVVLSAKVCLLNPYLRRENHKSIDGTDDLPKVDTSNPTTTICKTAASNHTSTNTHSNRPPNMVVFPQNNDTAIATSGIIPLLLTYNLNDTNHNKSRRTSLILASSSGRMLHIQQKDKWSCGYRNLQMLLSAILPDLTSSVRPQNQPQQSPLQRYTLPSLYDIQVSLETLWSHGYDRKGAEHYHYRIKNQAQWIGAVEVANYLSYKYHVDTTVIEFILCPESRSLLIPFCISYFTQQSPTQHLPTCPYGSHFDENASTHCNSLSTLTVVRDILTSIEQGKHNRLNDVVIPTCTCPTTVPLYLQWNGHSVTIIGIELSTQQLLILDPKCHGSNLRMTLQTPKPSQQQLPSALRLSMSKLIHKDCQVVVTSTTHPPLSELQLQHIQRNNVPSIIAATDAVMNVRRQQGIM